MLQIKSFCHPLALALATVTTCTLSEVASAALFNLSYTSRTGTLTAVVNGTLQNDNNRVFVSSIGDLTFNGSPAPALPLVGSYSILLTQGTISSPAVLTLNSSGLDFIACNTVTCGAPAFGFRPSGFFGSTNLLFATSSQYGSSENYNPANYSLTPAGTLSVPEPATVLGLLSVAGVGLLSKRRKLEK